MKTFTAEIVETTVTRRYVQIEAETWEEASDIAEDTYEWEASGRHDPDDYTIVEVMDIVED